MYECTGSPTFVVRYENLDNYGRVSESQGNFHILVISKICYISDITWNKVDM